MRELFISMFGETVVRSFAYHFSGVGVFFAVLTLLLAASTMTPFVTWLSAKKYIRSSKAMHEKYSWQMLQYSLVLTAITTVIFKVMFVVHFLYITILVSVVPEEKLIAEMVGDVQNFTFSVISNESFSSLGTIFIFMLLLFLLFAMCLHMWKKKRTTKALSSPALLPARAIGFFTRIAYYFCFFFIFRNMLIWAMCFLPVFEKKPFEIPLALFAGSLAITPFLWLTCIGAMAVSLTFALWLILRRKKEDFGRDYYTFAMHSSVRFALKALVLATLCILIHVALLVIAHQDIFSAQALCVTIFGVLIVPAICGVLLRNVSHSQTPMRHKVSIMCTLLCSIPLVLMHSASFLLILKIFLK